MLKKNYLKLRHCEFLRTILAEDQEERWSWQTNKFYFRRGRKNKIASWLKNHNWRKYFFARSRRKWKRLIDKKWKNSKWVIVQTFPRNLMDEMVTQLIGRRCCFKTGNLRRPEDRCWDEVAYFSLDLLSSAACKADLIPIFSSSSIWKKWPHSLVCMTHTLAEH